jgi:hypothetical protein
MSSLDTVSITTTAQKPVLPQATPCSAISTFRIHSKTLLCRFRGSSMFSENRLRGKPYRHYSSSLTRRYKWKLAPSRGSSYGLE